ncbi:MAG: hypothetical protein RML75_03785 [Cyanobacteriota bacterium SKYGB_h_bin112]|nr:hypothetical protein [Cyanobacteriota bacterium SKYGB_h_bin112]
MGLFDQIVSAINNPTQEASSDQLSNILNTVQQVAASQGIDLSKAQSVLSILGTHVRTALQAQRASQGESAATALVNQLASGANLQALQQLMGASQQQQVAQDVAQKTGLDISAIQAMLPTLIPVVMNLLKMGNTQPQAGNSGGNPLLNAFLDADKDGDVDLGDAILLGSQYLSQRK